MKLVIFGGGSSYTPELVSGVIEHYDALPFDEICLMDISEERLTVLAGLSRRMLAHAGLPVTVTATTDRRKVLRGAHYIIKCIEVSGVDCVRFDNDIPAGYGVDQWIAGARWRVPRSSTA